jgi:hypothetical protein
VSFNLTKVRLGEDENGDPVESAVVSYLRQKSASKALPQQAARALEILEESIGRLGCEVGDGNAAAFTGLSIEEALWRELCAKAQLSRDGLEQSERKAFQRARKALLANRNIALNAGRVWLAEPIAAEEPAAAMPVMDFSTGAGSAWLTEWGNA